MEKNNFPAITEDGFIKIIEYLYKFQKKTYVRMQISIIFKLILLYGFKLERIKYLQVGNYDENEGTLSIVVDDDVNITPRLILELLAYGTDIKYEIIEEIGVLSDNAKGWRKEINPISWNDAAPKYDIRDWSQGHEKMGKGVTLTKEEVEKLKEIL
jgi:hypothetical protein